MLNQQHVYFCILKTIRYAKGLEERAPTRNMPSVHEEFVGLLVQDEKSTAYLRLQRLLKKANSARGGTGGIDYGCHGD